MVPRRRIAWLALFAGAGGCTGLLGVDLDYHAVGTGGGTGGGSTTSTTASTGGRSTTSTTSTASTSGTGGHGGVQTGTGGEGTGGDAGTSDAGHASTSDAGTGDASTSDASDASTDASDASTDAEVCDASIVVDAGDAGFPCADAGPNSGQIVVTVLSIAGGVDYGALMAIAGGTPSRQVAGNPTLWPIEAAKTWYTISAAVSFPTPVSTYSTCVPPGDYTLYLWDRYSGGLNGFDNGIPPNTTYPWGIGNSSRTITVTAGGVVTVTAADTNVNVPDGGAFYGSWTIWDYGTCSCNANCPSGTTCYQGTCVDLAYDIRNCGAAGSACTSADCCNGACVPELTDSANCGGCGVVCQAPKACTSGACQ